MGAPLLVQVRATTNRMQMILILLVVLAWASPSVGFAGLSTRSTARVRPEPFCTLRAESLTSEVRSRSGEHHPGTSTSTRSLARRTAGGGWPHAVTAFATAALPVAAALAVSGGGLDYANLDISGKDFSNGNYKGKDFTQGTHAVRKNFNIQ